MELLVDSGLVALAMLARTGNDAAVASYGSEYEAMGSVLDVPGETDAESLAGAESHQIVDAAGVAAVVSRDGDDARRVDVSESLSTRLDEAVCDIARV
jgi:predicted ATPase